MYNIDWLSCSRSKICDFLFISQEYASNPAQNWKAKDVAVYLVTSLAAKAQTQKVERNIFLSSLPLSLS